MCPQCLCVQQSLTKTNWTVTGSVPHTVPCVTRVPRSSSCDTDQRWSVTERPTWICVWCAALFHTTVVHSCQVWKWSGFRLSVTELVLCHLAGCVPATTGLSWTSHDTAWLRKDISAGNVVTGKPRFLPPKHATFHWATVKKPRNEF